MGSFFSKCKCNNHNGIEEPIDAALASVDMDEKTYLQYIPNYDSIPYFIPQIKYAKVTDIRENYTIVVAARFPNKNKDSPIYRFPIKLKHIDLTTYSSKWSASYSLDSRARDALFTLICSEIVELRNVENCSGMLSAEVYFGRKECASEWLVSNNLAIALDGRFEFVPQ